MPVYVRVGMMREHCQVMEDGVVASERRRTAPGLYDMEADAVYTASLPALAVETVDRLSEQVCTRVESAILTPNAEERLAEVHAVLDAEEVYAPPDSVEYPGFSMTGFDEATEEQFAALVGRAICPYGFSGVDVLSRSVSGSWLENK